MINDRPVDLLDELLAPLRLEGVFVSRWQVRGPWGVHGDQERNAILHYVRSGECAITMPAAAAPVTLRAGELAVFPWGAAHAISDRPGRATSPLELFLPGRPAGSTSTVRVDGPGPATDLLCGGLHYDEAAVSPLYRSLPEIIVLDRAALDAEPLLAETLRGLTGRYRGLAALRAFELVFVLALRTALDRLDGMPPALRDPAIGRALLAIETRYAEPWTLESLAGEARMSRSAFAAAFTRLVGDAPARYLAGRRMREAALLLTTTDLPLAAIPERVGYRSSVGFHLAFRRHTGVPPGEYRRLARPGEGRLPGRTLR